MTKTSLDELFNRNSHLFAVMGVFGAISVYFTQLELETRWQRLGIISSLTIFILLAIAIYRNIPPESSDKSPFDFIINIQRRKPGYAIFYVAFGFVVFSVIGIVTGYSNTLLFLFQFLLFLGGIGITKYFVNRPWDQIEEDEVIFGEVKEGSLTFVEDEEVALLFRTLLRNAMIAFTVGIIALSILWLMGEVPVHQLVEFQIESPWAAILVGIFSGFLIGGFLWGFIGAGFLFLNYMYGWAKRKGIFDDSWELNEEYFAIEQKGNK